MPDTTVVIVGAGIVGLAIAREILTRYPEFKVSVLEKEADVGTHQTGHNSGVIHTGIYYRPGSFKAEACVRGRQMLLDYCDTHSIPYNLCGKVIVATDPGELPLLQDLYERGKANGVKGLGFLGAEELREREPHVHGIRAVWSPGTGIVDFKRVTAQYADDVNKMGGTIRTGYTVHRINSYGARRILWTSQGEIETDYVLVCAGLHADVLARRQGLPRDPQIVPFRGDYYLLQANRRDLVQGLIYPVPDPSLPFLGVHFTPRMEDDSVLLGPNAVFAFAREGYRVSKVNFADLGDVFTYPGFWRLARKYAAYGLSEFIRDISKTRFLNGLQRYLPELQAEDIVPGPSGVRAQTVARDGSLSDDFDVMYADGVVHVRNAPSPAATSSLALAEHIVDRVQTLFGWPAVRPA